MNKKISIPIIIAILAIIIVTIVVLRGTQDNASKLSEIYNKILENETYSFTRYTIEEKDKEVVRKKNDKTLIDTYDLGEHTSTLIAEGNTYLISHEYKEYYVYPSSAADENVLLGKIKNVIEKEYTTGKEKIYGITYKYEEYSGVSSFLFSEQDTIEPNSVKTRFYFKGNEVVYLKTIYNVKDEETGTTTEKEELQTVKVEYEVNNSVFEIPADYAEN